MCLPCWTSSAGYGLKLALLSNTGRDLDAFVAHHSIQVDAILTSRLHGKTKPHETIFRAMLERLGVPAEHAAMVGDDPTDDVEGARAVGMRAWLVDRDDRFPSIIRSACTDLRELPAALGLGRAAP